MNKIAFLRGINVSGKNKVDMKTLKPILIEHFQVADTYLNTGNLMLKSKMTDVELQTKIHQIIEEHFSLDIEVIVVSLDELIEIVKEYPFMGDKNHYITVFKERVEPVDDDHLSDKLNDDDEVEVHDKYLYFHVPGGYGKTKFTNKMVEKKLECVATTRNIKTMNKLIKKMQ